MHIDNFAEKVKKEVDIFVRNWKKQHSRGKQKLDKDATFEEAYPLEMPEEEFFEQFLVAETSEKGIVEI